MESAPGNGNGNRNGKGNGQADGGWQVTGGGWTSNGCDGTVAWAQTTDAGGAWQDAATWSFSPPATAAACAVAVFVPPGAGGVASYDIYGAGAVADLVPLASASIDQAAYAGQWVWMGSYATIGGALQIRLTNSPQDAGPPYPVAASAVSATCA
jgi:hypothetical protein